MMDPRRVPLGALTGNPVVIWEQAAHAGALRDDHWWRWTGVVWVRHSASCSMPRGRWWARHASSCRASESRRAGVVGETILLESKLWMLQSSPRRSAGLSRALPIVAGDAGERDFMAACHPRDDKSRTLKSQLSTGRRSHRPGSRDSVLAGQFIVPSIWWGRTFTLSAVHTRLDWQ